MVDFSSAFLLCTRKWKAVVSPDEMENPGSKGDVAVLLYGCVLHYFLELGCIHLEHRGFRDIRFLTFLFSNFNPILTPNI